MESVEDVVFASPMMVVLGYVCLGKKGVTDPQHIWLLHKRAGSNFTKVICLISSPVFDVSGMQQTLMGLQLSNVFYTPEISTKMNRALRLAVCCLWRESGWQVQVVIHKLYTEKAGHCHLTADDAVWKAGGWSVQEHILYYNFWEVHWRFLLVSRGCNLEP